MTGDEQRRRRSRRRPRRRRPSRRPASRRRRAPTRACARGAASTADDGLDVRALGEARVHARAGAPPRSSGNASGSSTVEHAVRVADRDEAVGDAGIRRVAILLRALERGLPEPHRDAPVGEHASPSPVARARAHAQLAGARAARRRSATAMRVPLPEISAIEPSRLCTTTATSSPSSASSSTPSAPRPSATSQSSRARAGVIAPGRLLDDQEVVAERLPFRDAHGPNGNDQRGCQEAGERRGHARDRLAVDPLARLVRLVRLARPVVDGRDARAPAARRRPSRPASGTRARPSRPGTAPAPARTGAAARRGSRRARSARPRPRRAPRPRARAAAASRPGAKRTLSAISTRSGTTLRATPPWICVMQSVSWNVRPSTSTGRCATLRRALEERHGAQRRRCRPPRAARCAPCARGRRDRR